MAEAKDNDLDQPWAVGGDWQFQRSIYVVQMPSEGWWVQVDHADTLTALSLTLAGVFDQHGLGTPALTSGHIESEDRALTTLIGQHVRDCLLDDGSEALGITFRSKTLHGRCWAYFDRRADLGLPPGGNDPKLLESTNVGTPAFREVAEQMKLPVLPGRPRH